MLSNQLFRTSLRHFHPICSQLVSYLLRFLEYYSFQLSTKCQLESKMIFFSIKLFWTSLGHFHPPICSQLGVTYSDFQNIIHSNCQPSGNRCQKYFFLSNQIIVDQSEPFSSCYVFPVSQLLIQICRILFVLNVNQCQQV